jgi:hypothetical protein
MTSGGETKEKSPRNKSLGKNPSRRYSVAQRMKKFQVEVSVKAIVVIETFEDEASARQRAYDKVASAMVYARITDYRIDAHTGRVNPIISIEEGGTKDGSPS